MKSKTSILFLLFISLSCFSQTKEIQETINRVIYNNKVGFIKNGFVIVPFEYELEPVGKRHIGRYLKHDTIFNPDEYKKYEVRFSIIEPNKENISDTVKYDIKKDYSKNFYKGYTNDDFSYCNAKFLDNTDEEGYYNEGFYAVYKNGKYGYIDTNGKLIIPLEYEKANDFIFLKNTDIHNWSSGSYEDIKNNILGFYVGIAKKNGKYGIINDRNETILNFIFDDILYHKTTNEYLYLKQPNANRDVLQCTHVFFCIYKNKIYFMNFKNGVFELPEELTK